MLIPDLAKSAATLICLRRRSSAFRARRRPGTGRPTDAAGRWISCECQGDRRGRGRGGARITRSNPDTFRLFSSLLSDVNMLMVEQARSALERSGALVREALQANGRRSPQDVDNLAEQLHRPLIEEPTSHSAVIPCDAAVSFGLPATPADPASETWRLIWALWTRYFTLGCFPAGQVAVYEGEKGFTSHAARHLVVVPSGSRTSRKVPSKGRSGASRT